MFINLENYIILKEYCEINQINTNKITRNKKIITIKIGKNRFILKKSLSNISDLNLYTNLKYLYPIGEFFVKCGVSKSYKQTLTKQNIKTNIIIHSGIHFIKLNQFFFTLISKNLIPIIINRDNKDNRFVKILYIQNIKIGFFKCDLHIKDK